MRNIFLTCLVICYIKMIGNNEKGHFHYTQINMFSSLPYKMNPK